MRSAAEQLAIMIQGLLQNLISSVLVLQLGLFWNVSVKPYSCTPLCLDPALQPLFLEKGGLDYVIQLLRRAVKKPEDYDEVPLYQ